jgi:hypothetical protein
MSTIDEIVAHAQRLPEDLRVETLRFIEFLETKSIAQNKGAGTPISADEDKTERGRRVAAILKELADLGTFSNVKDPVQWQRRIREDRPLPGRD